MIDRIVRQLIPKPDVAHQRRPFSAFSEQPNIILLGAPGAGKTYLFTEAAAETGNRVTTRDFLNIPSFPSNAVLFIDALDECRTGRGDQGTIDAVVRKLFDVRPKKVRISCRESDWLGSTDLATFQPYFDANGGSVVLALEDLTAEEQQDVLKTQGVTNPDEFLKEAINRDLKGLLTNPQNLAMLAKAVGSGNWPRNRKELFQKATGILLSEHNATRARSGDGVYRADELRAPAGSLLAARLISDVGGVSLADNQVSDDYPSYRTAPFPDIQRVRAALGRRAFIGNGEEAADYTHRTTAEFLGAEWIANQIEGGLPIGRVRALIGVDGHPASELRGLHAWLAVHCPAHANELIDADPYGVLTYGDADALSPSHRKRLLTALSRLSEADPWFGRSDQTMPNIGALASKELAPSFRAILRSKTATFALKALVLSVLAAGTPLIGVMQELLPIFLNPKEPYALRDLSFDGLKRLGAAGAEAIKQHYAQLGKGDSDVRLRATVIGDLYQKFSLSELADVLNDASECPVDLPGGIFWPLHLVVPTADIPALIDNILVQRSRLSPDDTAIARAQRHNAHDVGITVTHFIVRYLKEANQPISADTFWKMLIKRRALAGDHPPRDSDELYAELKLNPQLLYEMLECAINEISEDTLDNGALWTFRHTTLQTMENAALAQCVWTRVRSAVDSPVKRAFLYRLAIQLAVAAESELFDEIYFFGESQADLAAIRDDCVFSTIENWQREDSLDKAQQAAETRAAEAKILQDFERDKEDIEGGKHLGWLAWLSEFYFDIYSEAEPYLTPRKRLEHRIGTKNVEIALRGFQACLQRTDLPSVRDVGKAALQNSYPIWWYALIAGMDETWAINPKLTSFSEEFLKVMAAVKLVLSTHERRGNVYHNMDHRWQQTLLREHPNLVARVYTEIAGMSLARKSKSVHGLHELFSDQTFANDRKRITLDLLKRYFASPAQQLSQMLCTALAYPEAHEEIYQIAAKTTLNRSDRLDADQRELWLAAGFLVRPNEHKQTIRKAAKKPGIIWHIRSLLSGLKGNNHGTLTVEQIEFLIKIVASHFPAVPHPSSSWGNQNPWDGAEFCRNLINSLSTRHTKDASASLGRLAQLPLLATYRDFIKHTHANQRVRMREAEYRQPNWAQTTAALLNGPPANFADLQALVLDHCRDLNNEIANRNIDTYRQFWNEGSHGRPSTPRSEETSRDLLVGMLQTRLRPLNITVEPEGHMAADKRVDVSVALNHRKTMMEWKRDYHPDVWHAHETQLDRLYTPDPDASGYGIYGVFWFGPRRPRNIRARPNGGSAPKTAEEMQQILAEMIPMEKREKLGVIVLDVSGPVGSVAKAETATTARKKAGKPRKHLRVKRAKPKTAPPRKKSRTERGKPKLGKSSDRPASKR